MSEALLEQSKNYRKIEKIIQYLDRNFIENPSIETLSEHVGMSKYHFIRTFKRYVGVTPLQFLHVLRLNYVREQLKKSQSILESSLELGFTSPSRLHDLCVTIVGVTPKEYRELGKNLEITYGYGFTPFGEALIGFTRRGVCYLGFIKDEEDTNVDIFKSLWQRASLNRDDAQASMYLNKIFLKHEKYELYVKGTNFQINVWKALLQISEGGLLSYGDIARTIDRPKAVRAVANAIGSNHIGYLIPCHRVIAKSGAMSGYRWGVERKKIICAFEALKKTSIKP